MPAKGLRRPLVKRRSVQPDFAPTGCQTPTISRANEDFPEALGPIMPRPSPLFSAKFTSCKHDPRITRRAGADRSRPPSARAASATASGCLRSGSSSEQLGQALAGLARGDKALPIGDRKLDRSKRARHKDRTGNDDAGGGLLVDHEIGAKPKHERLQHKRMTRDSASKHAGAVRGARVGCACSRR